ncbi:MAG: ABC transporter substrate-binding protein [Proteobacteria bacterium]|nr:ABC transporter substrate-binding protein [Pseudomonadota bacterium]
MLERLLLCALLSTGLASAALAEQTPPAHADAPPVVERLHATLLEVMRHSDEWSYEKRAAALEPVVHGCFDLDFMAQKSVGRHWKKLSDDDRVRWLATFRRLIVSNYAGRFVGYDDHSFATGELTPMSHDTVLVRTRLSRPGEEDVQLNYRLRPTPDGWRIIDVLLNGTVSELALRRSEYSSVIANGGFEGLLATLDRKIADLATGTAAKPAS